MCRVRDVGRIEGIPTCRERDEGEEQCEVVLRHFGVLYLCHNCFGFK